jgi:hypothetical protein
VYLDAVAMSRLRTQALLPLRANVKLWLIAIRLQSDNMASVATNILFRLTKLVRPAIVLANQVITIRTSVRMKPANGSFAAWRQLPSTSI